MNAKDVPATADSKESVGQNVIIAYLQQQGLKVRKSKKEQQNRNIAKRTRSVAVEKMFPLYKDSDMIDARIFKKRVRDQTAGVSDAIDKMTDLGKAKFMKDSYMLKGLDIAGITIKELLDANYSQNMIPTANQLPPKQYKNAEEFISMVQSGMKDANTRNFEQVAKLLTSNNHRGVGSLSRKRLSPASKRILDKARASESPLKQSQTEQITSNVSSKVITQQSGIQSKISFGNTTLNDAQAAPFAGNIMMENSSEPNLSLLKNLPSEKGPSFPITPNDFTPNDTENVKVDDGLEGNHRRSSPVLTKTSHFYVTNTEAGGLIIPDEGNIIQALNHSPTSPEPLAKTSIAQFKQPQQFTQSYRTRTKVMSEDRASKQEMSQFMHKAKAEEKQQRRIKKAVLQGFNLKDLISGKVKIPNLYADTSSESSQSSVSEGGVPERDLQFMIDQDKAKAIKKRRDDRRRAKWEKRINENAFSSVKAQLQSAMTLHTQQKEQQDRDQVSTLMMTREDQTEQTPKNENPNRMVEEFLNKHKDMLNLIREGVHGNDAEKIDKLQQEAIEKAKHDHFQEVGDLNDPDKVLDVLECHISGLIENLYADQFDENGDLIRNDSQERHADSKMDLIEPPRPSYLRNNQQLRKARTKLNNRMKELKPGHSISMFSHNWVQANKLKAVMKRVQSLKKSTLKSEKTTQRMKTLLMFGDMIKEMSSKKTIPYSTVFGGSSKGFNGNLPLDEMMIGVARQMKDLTSTNRTLSSKMFELGLGPSSPSSVTVSGLNTRQQSLKQSPTQQTAFKKKFEVLKLSQSKDQSKGLRIDNKSVPPAQFGPNREVLVNKKQIEKDHAVSQLKLENQPSVESVQKLENAPFVASESRLDTVEKALQNCITIKQSEPIVRGEVNTILGLHKDKSQLASREAGSPLRSDDLQSPINSPLNSHPRETEESKSAVDLSQVLDQTKVETAKSIMQTMNSPNQTIKQPSTAQGTALPTSKHSAQPTPKQSPKQSPPVKSPPVPQDKKQTIRETSSSMVSDQQEKIKELLEKPLKSPVEYAAIHTKQIRQPFAEKGVVDFTLTRTTFGAQSNTNVDDSDKERTMQQKIAMTQITEATKKNVSGDASFSRDGMNQDLKDVANKSFILQKDEKTQFNKTQEGKNLTGPEQEIERAPLIVVERGESRLASIKHSKPLDTNQTFKSSKNMTFHRQKIYDELPTQYKGDFKDLCKEIDQAGDLSSYRESLNSFYLVGTSKGFKKVFKPKDEEGIAEANQATEQSRAGSRWQTGDITSILETGGNLMKNHLASHDILPPAFNQTRNSVGRDMEYTLVDNKRVMPPFKSNHKVIKGKQKEAVLTKHKPQPLGLYPAPISVGVRSPAESSVNSYGKRMVYSPSRVGSQMEIELKTPPSNAGFNSKAKYTEHLSQQTLESLQNQFMSPSLPASKKRSQVLRPAIAQVAYTSQHAVARTDQTDQSYYHEHDLYQSTSVEQIMVNKAVDPREMNIQSRDRLAWSTSDRNLSDQKDLAHIDSAERMIERPNLDAVFELQGSVPNLPDNELMNLTNRINHQIKQRDDEASYKVGSSDLLSIEKNRVPIKPQVFFAHTSGGKTSKQAPASIYKQAKKEMLQDRLKQKLRDRSVPKGVTSPKLNVHELSLGVSEPLPGHKRFITPRAESKQLLFNYQLNNPSYSVKKKESKFVEPQSSVVKKHVYKPEVPKPDIKPILEEELEPVADEVREHALLVSREQAESREKLFPEVVFSQASSQSDTFQKQEKVEDSTFKKDKKKSRSPTKDRARGSQITQKQSHLDKTNNTNVGAWRLTSMSQHSGLMFNMASKSANQTLPIDSAEDSKNTLGNKNSLTKTEEEALLKFTEESQKLMQQNDIEEKAIAYSVVNILRDKLKASESQKALKQRPSALLDSMNQTESEVIKHEEQTEMSDRQSQEQTPMEPQLPVISPKYHNTSTTHILRSPGASPRHTRNQTLAGFLQSHQARYVAHDSLGAQGYRKKKKDKDLAGIKDFTFASQPNAVGYTGLGKTRKFENMLKQSSSKTRMIQNEDYVNEMLERQRIDGLVINSASSPLALRENK